MAIKEIQKEQWQTYFDTFSNDYLKDEQPEYAEIRILSSDSGNQRETGWLPLEGITFNPKDDILDIRVETLNRMVHNPMKIYVDEYPDGWMASMEIIERNGNRDIIEFR